MVAVTLKENNRRIIYVLVTALIFTDTVLYGAIVPLIPHYMKTLNLTTSAMGLIFSAYAFGLLILSIPSGLLAEKYGYKNVFLIGMATLGISSYFFGLVQSPFALFFCRLIQGAAGAASWTAGLALVATIYPKQQGEKIGLLMAVVGMGTIFGPPIGGLFYRFFGYRFMFLVLSLLCLALFLGICFVSFKGINKSPALKLNLNMFSPLKDTRVFWLSLVVVMLASIFGMLEILIPNHLDIKFSTDALQIGFFFGYLGIIHAITAAYAGRLSDKYGYEGFVFAGLLANALCLPFLALAPKIYIFLIVFTFVGVASGSASTPSQPLMYKIISRRQGSDSGGAGYIYGFYNTIYSLGMFLGPLLGGFLNRNFSLFLSLLVFSCLFIFSATLFYNRVLLPEKKADAFSAKSRKETSYHSLH